MLGVDQDAVMHRALGTEGSAILTGASVNGILVAAGICEISINSGLCEVEPAFVVVLVPIESITDLGGVHATATVLTRLNGVDTSLASTIG